MRLATLTVNNYAMLFMYRYLPKYQIQIYAVLLRLHLLPRYLFPLVAWKLPGNFNPLPECLFQPL